MEEAEKEDEEQAVFVEVKREALVLCEEERRSVGRPCTTD
jgi:hypothetical protein